MIDTDGVFQFENESETKPLQKILLNQPITVLCERSHKIPD